MALVDLQNISKQFEAQKVLCNINFTIDEGERIAIIGKNGSGKSTLMKIIDNALEFDEGKRLMQQNVSIKMLTQKPSFKEGIIVRDAIEESLFEIRQVKQTYDALSLRLAKEFDNDEVLKAHSEASAFLDFHNAWNLDNKIERVLEEFHLKPYEDKIVNLLSGGEQKRVALASLLLQKPDILMLDEPTNHLDVYMVEFLEEMILKERFTLIFVSHDRYFIDQVATKSVEIEACMMRDFKGGYSDYLRQKEELLKNLQKQHENLLKLLKSEEEWLSRGVKARLKRDEGRKQRVLQMREDAKKNPSAIRKMRVELEREKKHFNREDGVNRKKMLFELEQICKSIEDKRLIEDFTTRILQRDRIAIVGKNGTGKSTLLKILLGKMAVDSGKIKQGEFKIGYFDQHREMLDDDKNLIETFCPNGGDRVMVQGKDMHVFGYLKNFLFPKEYLDKKIGILSGGEKNRVALALLFAKNIDCLILDEPTNDLDIPTINILEEYLTNFSGSLIFVSHDRYFVDKIAKKLFIFKGNGVIEESYQSYSEYLEIEKELHNLEKFEKEVSAPKKVQKLNKQNKLSYKEQREIESLPAQIETLEAHIEALNDCLANPDCYKDRGIETIAKELEESEAVYEERVERFLELEEKQESFLG